MSFPEDAVGTFEGRLGCPSELVVDRFVTGELSERSTAELKAHLDGCDVCRRRVLQRRSAESGPKIDRARALASIQARVSAPELPASAAPGRWRQNAWLLLLPLFAALGALLVWWLRRH